MVARKISLNITLYLMFFECSCMVLSFTLAVASAMVHDTAGSK